MKFIKSSVFIQQIAKLEKKFQKISWDMDDFESSFSILSGVSLGQSLYKFRLKNSSIPTGQRSGFRIVWLLLDSDTILLVSVYSKTEKTNMTVTEIEQILMSL